MGPQTLPSPPWDQGEDAVRLLQKHTKMLILRLPSDQVGQASAPLKTAAQVWLTFQDALHRVPQSSFAGLCFQNFPGLWDSPVKEVALWPLQTTPPQKKKPTKKPHQLLTPSLPMGTHAQVFLGFSREWRSEPKFLEAEKRWSHFCRNANFLPIFTWLFANIYSKHKETSRVTSCQGHAITKTYSSNFPALPISSTRSPLVTSLRSDKGFHENLPFPGSGGEKEKKEKKKNNQRK